MYRKENNFHIYNKKHSVLIRDLQRNRRYQINGEMNDRQSERLMIDRFINRQMDTWMDR